MEINEIIDKLFDYFNVSSIQDLSQKMNVSQPTISKWKNRNAISAVKKRCRELGIYNDIFGDSFTTFSQTGANSQQIQNQNNSGDGSGAFNNSNDSKAQIDNSLKIDNDFIPLFEALSTVAIALDKKVQLKIELTKLISDLPKL